MKTSVSTLVGIVLACCCAFLVIIKARAQRSSTPQDRTFSSSLEVITPSVPPEKTVEQVQKNIKVLTGMPESQLLPAMELFETSLGVTCV